jgi:phosphoribosyl 1,2-cyclic phosphodiesterase
MTVTAPPRRPQVPERRSVETLTVRFWGVRGSFPVSNPGCQRYGGNTSCVEVRLGKRLFVIDAGSGLVGLGRQLATEGPRDVDILFSHLHHDHVAGLPFFEPLLMEGSHIRTHVGNLEGEDARASLDRMFAPPLFPLRLDDLPGRISYVGFRAGETLTFPDGCVVKTCPLDHPNGATGYRFEHAGRVLCFVCDVEHREGEPAPELVTFVTGADLVIYDAMFGEAEYEAFKGWGHSTWQAGVRLCKAGGARVLAAFHHHPSADDHRLDAIESSLAAALPGSFCASEGETVVLSSQPFRAGMVGL